MAHNDDLVSRLREWGLATVARYEQRRHGPSHGVHMLTKQKDLAPGTKERALRELMGRNGESRRLRMGAAAGIAIVPVWSCDPVPARNDADRPHDNPETWHDPGIPDHLRSVEAAIRSLQNGPNGALRALIVREEYTGTGTQRMKCGRVQAAYAGKLTLRMYRHELYRAQDFLRGRLPAR